jgi:hypothetical protein
VKEWETSRNDRLGDAVVIVFCLGAIVLYILSRWLP